MTGPVFKPAVPEPGPSEEQRTNARDIMAQRMSPERAGDIESVLWEACKATHKIRVSGKCPKCECQHVRYAEETDYATAVKAIELYMREMYGRPGTAGVEEAGVVVKRIVVGVDE